MNIDLLPLAIKVWRDGTSEEGPFLAYSAELKLVAGGKTPQEAKDKLVQIIEDILAEEASEERWARLFAKPEAQRAMIEMAHEALAEEDAGLTLEMTFDEDGNLIEPT